jgi:hypothetical protein
MKYLKVKFNVARIVKLYRAGKNVSQIAQAIGYRLATATPQDHSDPIQCSRCLNRGGTMGNLTNALQELRAERKQAQLQVEKLDQAISVIESLNGLGTFGKANQPTRIISAASRRKMARAQKARWAKARNESQPLVATAKTTGSAPVKHTMSAAARRKIAAFQRARWAKLKAGKKAA